MIKEHCSGDWKPGLTDGEKRTLFAIAEDTLQWCIRRGEERFDFGKYELSPKLHEKTATFVTLKIQGDLRGCIGSLAPVQPLYESIHENAINAALRDPRFSQVRPAELPKLEVHLSILSPVRDIESPEEFRVGEHGIIFEKGPFRSVFLPEVAPEQGWTREDTLRALCRKAGAPQDAWKTGARFKVFSSVALSKE
jgi:AmmeMemoRadiSam system protein A